MDKQNNKQIKSPTAEAKYIRQHLANERTYLAWIRTAIAIIGIGFLVSNLHLTTQSNTSLLGDMLVNVIGLCSVGLGIVTILMATIAYLKKRTAINNESSHSSSTMIVVLSIFVIIIAIVFGVYFIII